MCVSPDSSPASESTSADGGVPPIRVLIVDDHAAVRAGLSMILRTAPDVTVVGEAQSGSDAITLAAELRPDVVLMDLRMPGMSGEQATRALRRSGTHVLVLTTFDDDASVFGAIRAGAKGFVLKSTDAPSLIAAVRQVSAGAGALAPEVTDRVFSALRSPAKTQRAGRSRHPAAGARSINGITLTQREWQVLGEIGAGHPNAVISERLGIRQGTVKSHITRLLAKLGVRSRLQAALLAREAGVPNAGPADPTE
ncbi:response regulator transcription factor [Leucobacter tardus]|uniref:Response regulator transcription factor n=1 Tax=Leucobacter tardus TaxID=501483 RepID=A0A939QDJ0_9MICO|nr:response regulator transcription factor [Leucobacter tardus]MBO2990182.1 response regulator transcription factor [Leucobacter tardus]